ncbi:MAG: HAMP domain-containing histidine kinase [Bacteroidales bacterium]|nr:HAMP domain-containing histidine kinase [Bacteroidales bacterium]
MEIKLIPAHIHFIKWFIRIRWFAVIILVASNLIIKHFFHLSIQETQVYILTIILFILNVLHTVILRRITQKESSKVIVKIKQEIHFQIITDLIVLTLILHFSGGIENPVVLFYFFHMIIASSIFSTLESYLYVAYALILVSLLALLECFSIIPHYHLDGFVPEGLYKNVLYVLGTGFVFTCTSIILVSLSHMIIYRSIKSEETYVKSNQELENKDKLKNEYVLRVTHDIKGHVAAILSCIDVIRTKIAGPLNEVQEEFANRAYERTELLTSFVKNLLNLTRKRLKHDSEFEEFSFKDLLNKVITPVRILAGDKSIDFNIYIDNTIHNVTGNPLALEELYSNLLLNAVKYTPPDGHIALTVRDQHDTIFTEISDSGIGIPKEELSKVFDEFYRGTNVPKDIKAGSGLGLSIVKQIIDNHKGSIWVSSELGVWTKFSFTLPKNPAVIV